MIFVKNPTFTSIFGFLFTFVRISSQEPSVKLRQGILIGIQIYPESYPGPIHAYLGIPYAVPPVGINRFSPPKKHPGWNRTLVASNNPPNCPHLSDNSEFSQRQSEDCLFINIWTPVVSERMGQVPVVVYIDGIDFNRLNALHQISGQDLAAEGVVVVTLNYRLHALGFLCFGDRDLRGNFGLLDQYMALLWVHENIASFGGDSSSVTLMGQDSGAISVLYHLISPRTKNLFSRAIIMVGSIKSIWDLRHNASEIISASKMIVKHLQCPLDNNRSTLECLRNKNPEEIITNFPPNRSFDLGPVSDMFLSTNEQFINVDVLQAIQEGKFLDIPVMIGFNQLDIITELPELWLKLKDPKTYKELFNIISKEILPEILQIYSIDPEYEKLITNCIIWFYFENDSENIEELLERLKTLLIDAKFYAPIVKYIRFLTLKSQPTYVYKFLHEANNSELVFSSPLSFLFGPTLFQQLMRRRGRQFEMQLMKKIKSFWANFIKFGNPTPGKSFNIWTPSSKNNIYIQNLGGYSSVNFETNSGDNLEFDRRTSFWNHFLDTTRNPEKPKPILTKSTEMTKIPRVFESSGVYRHATYTLTGLVISLLALLFICIVLLKQRSRERQKNSDF